MGRNLLGKIIITGKIKCETGLHVGASRENMEIGAIDSPVVRDPITREPYIPGSSLKGRLRALLEKGLASEVNSIATVKRNIGTQKNDILIHVCNDAADALNCPVCRLFGSTKGEGNKAWKNFPARLIVRDAHLTTDSVNQLSDIDTGLQYTEWKFENAIDRVTSAANPRQIERVPKGAEFAFEMIYNVEEIAQINQDMENLNLALDLLQLDALGGHGSRGYGKISVSFICISGRSIQHIKGVKDGKAQEIKSLREANSLTDVFTVTDEGR